MVNIIERSAIICNRVRFDRYMRRRFINWKNRVMKHIPQLAIDLYTAKMNGIFIDSDEERRLGRVINDLCRHSYGIQDEYGKSLDTENRIASEIMLEIDVNCLFSFVKKLNSKICQK